MNLHVDKKFAQRCGCFLPRERGRIEVGERAWLFQLLEW